MITETHIHCRYIHWKKQFGLYAVCGLRAVIEESVSKTIHGNIVLKRAAHGVAQ